MSVSGSLRIGCLVMAAGNSSRYGGNKLLQELGGKTLIQRTLDAVPKEEFFRVSVVSQYPEILSLADNYGFSAFLNDRPGDGISRTVRIGTESLRDCDGILFMVSDQPFLQCDSVRRLLSIWRNDPSRIVCASHEGHRGNPCLFPSSVFTELISLQGDRGGSQIIRSRPELVVLAELPERELLDCDTPQSLKDISNEV